MKFLHQVSPEEAKKAKYVKAVLRMRVPDEDLADFARHAYGVSATSFEDLARVVVQRGEANIINEKINDYLRRKGVVLDLFNMTPEEIWREFGNDKKYPDVEAIRKKLPKELRSFVPRTSRKETAIRKIIEEVEKLTGVRRLAGL
jgi:hypothetical protein